MARVRIILNKQYESKDGYQIVYKIANRGTHSHLSSGITIPEKYWDEKKLIKRNAPGIQDNSYTNAQLNKDLSEIQAFITSLTSSRQIYDLTASQIKERYLKEKTNNSYDFNTYFDYYLETRKADKTKDTYRYSRNTITGFHTDSLLFSDVSVKFLRDFEKYLIDKGIGINSISIHMRNIRTVFNAAIDDDIIDLSLYPFRKFKIKKEKTKKRNLSIEEMKIIRDVELKGVPSLARDIFMLSFYLIGINLIDLAYLTKDNIRAGRLEYKRRKTGKEYSIKLEPEARKLIKKLRGKTYLICLAERYKEYDSVKKEINKKLKVAAQKAELNKQVSTYYCRHSWATIASKLDIPKETISAALGHEIGSDTTAIYIEYDMNKVDQANRKVIDSLSF
jgi:integrase